MELSLLIKILIAFYISGVAISMYTIYLPSYRIICSIDRNNILAKKPILSFLIVLVIFTIMFPFMAWIILFDDKVEKFQNGFIKGAMGINDRK
jgi:hypothetical protein